MKEENVETYSPGDQTNEVDAVSSTAEVMSADEDDDQAKVKTINTDGDMDGSTSNLNSNAVNEGSRPATAKSMKLIDILNVAIGPKEATDKHQLDLNHLYVLLLALLEKTGFKNDTVLVDGISLPTSGLIKVGSRENSEGMEVSGDGGETSGQEKREEANETATAAKEAAGGKRETSQEREDGDETTAPGSSFVSKTGSRTGSKAGSSLRTSEKRSDDDGSFADEDEDNETLPKRLKNLEDQVTKLQKFRKAATFKIQDLPTDAARTLIKSSELLGVWDLAEGEGGAGGGKGNGSGGSEKLDNISKTMSLLKGLPEMNLTELRGIAELLRRALAGTEWNQLKRLVAEINAGGDLRDFLKRMASIENILGIDAAQEEKGEATAEATAKSTAVPTRKPDGYWKHIQDLRKDLNNLGDEVKAILNGGGVEAAQATFEEMKQIWQQLKKHGSDLERSFAHIDGIESKLRDLMMQQTNVSRLTQSLKDGKADKKWVREELDEKADRNELDLKVDLDKFQKDMEEIDTVIGDLEAQISDAMVKFYRELNALKIAHDSKLDKECFAGLLNTTMEKMGHMEQMLAFVSELFNGDKAGNFLRNQVIRNNCCSCDRTVYNLSQVEPSIPKPDGMAAARSLAPATALRLDQVRRTVNNNNSGPISRSYNKTGANHFVRAVTEREALWRERSERARHGRDASPEAVGRVRIRDLRNFSNEAYYRETGPGEFLDTYAQDPRPAGGDYTQVRKEQKIPKTSSLALPALDEKLIDDHDVHSLKIQGASGTFAAVPRGVIDGTEMKSEENVARNNDAVTEKDAGPRNPPTTPL